MSERRGTKALETWCRRLTEGYPGVKVENMTTSWRDGLAFCAIIHHFRPDLIDFASLNPTNIYYNNSLAFTVAERQLGIPALLDAEDMVMYTVPDRLSILTYLSQFYQVFGNQTAAAAGAKQGTSQRIVPKRTALSSEMGMLSAASSSPPTKMSRPSTTLHGSRREPCFKCSFPVFLAERLNVGTKLYHRTCFRCARCHNQLSLANYYETESEGQYCCETCPDEEDGKLPTFDSLDNVKSIDTDSTKIRNRSLSDEEKSKGLVDAYSQDFEQSLEDNLVSKARNHFLSNHLLNEDPKSKSTEDLPNATLENLLRSLKPQQLPIRDELIEGPDCPHIVKLKSLDNLDSCEQERLKDLNCPGHKSLESPESVNSTLPKSREALKPLENLHSCEQTPRTDVGSKDLNSVEGPDCPDQKSHIAELKSVNLIQSKSREALKSLEHINTCEQTSRKDVCSRGEDLNCPEHILLEGPDCPDQLKSVNSTQSKSREALKSLENINTCEQTSRKDLNSAEDPNCPEPKSLEGPESLKSVKSLNLVEPTSLEVQNCAEVVSSKDLCKSQNDLSHPSKISSKDLSNAANGRLQFAPEITEHDIQIKSKSQKEVFSSQTDVSHSSKNSSKDLSNSANAPKTTKHDNQIIGTVVTSDTKQTKSDTKPSDSDIPPDLAIQDSKDVPPPLPDSKPPDAYPTDPDLGLDKQIDIPASLDTDLKTSLATPQTPEARTVNILVNNPPTKEDDIRRPASEEKLEEKLEEKTKEVAQSLVKKRMLIFEAGVTDVPLTHYESASSEDIDVKYKTVRSDVVDSLVLYSSTLSDPPSNTNENVLSKSIIEDLSDQSSVPINASLLEDSQYPEDLNPFGEEEDLKKIKPSIEDLTIITPPRTEDLKRIKPSTEDLTLITPPTKEEKPLSTNPFGDDQEDLKKIKPSIEDLSIITPPRIEDLRRIKPSMEDLTLITPPTKEEKRHSTNPFGSSDEDEPEPLVKQKPPRPPQPATRNEGRKVVEAPKVNLNPFWSDDEEPEEDVKEKPVPLPRSKHITTPEPRPRKPGLSNTASHYDSNSSLSSINSSIGHTPGRKKKPAPAPPPQGLTPEGSKSNSPSTSTHPSPKLTPRIRKNRKAPLPPSSTPFVTSHVTGDNCDISPITHDKFNQQSAVDSTIILSPVGSDIEKEKNSKDEKNRNRQSQNIPSPVLSDSDSLSISQQCSSSDKSTHGKWKRKKGPAPARPVPQRRQIRPLPLVELRRELDIIEMQQQGLEKQGVKLEQLIREKCEVPGNHDETALDPEVEDMVLELFELVNEKNELFRRQAELMYLRRQQRLEEEHADLEYQIRCLMERPERNKTDSDKAREEELINRLLEVVERRNEIVECLEMDRVREAEEDQSINSRLSQLASKKDEPVIETPVKLSKKEKKKMKKEKKLKEKGKNLDVDKDIDESETSSVGKEKKKKKWF